MDLSEFNWQLILIITVISAAVSYIGDRLGMKLGKRRISLFGLRPRYTSTVITVIAGFAVAVITLGAAAYTSGRVRNAFFGVNYLSRQITDLTAELRERQFQLQEMEIEVAGAKSELERLTAESEELRRGLAEMKEGRVIAPRGELLAQVPLAPGAGDSELDDAFVRLIEEAGRKLRDGGGSAEVLISEAERARVRADALGAEGRQVLRMSAPSNIVQGQSVEGVVSVFDSRRIYRDGDLLMSRGIDRPSGGEDAADTLFTMLKAVNRRAVADGVLPDPISGAVGSLGSVEFYDMADKLASGAERQMIEIFASGDIYSEGPVRLRVETRAQ